MLVLVMACQRTRPSAQTLEAQTQVNSTDPPAEITNQFGMTFRLVSVDASRSDHDASFPPKSYYFQQSELTNEGFVKYRDLAAGNGADRQTRMNDIRFPTEWREVSDLARELSRLDEQFDYRLPTQSEWMFACLNGYEQSSPGAGARSTVDPTTSSRPNQYGITGFMNYDAECASEPGLFVGKDDQLRRQPCRCRQSVRGNPDADDGLNELITARFVLVTSHDNASK